MRPTMSAEWNAEETDPDPIRQIQTAINSIRQSTRLDPPLLPVSLAEAGRVAEILDELHARDAARQEMTVEEMMRQTQKRKNDIQRDRLRNRRGRR